MATQASSCRRFCAAWRRAGEENRPLLRAISPTAFKAAQQLADRARAQSVEGTILTVVREMAEAAQQASAKTVTILSRLMQEIVTAARQSVARTPDLLAHVETGWCGRCGRAGPGDVPGGHLALTAASQFKASWQKHQRHTACQEGGVTIEEEFGYEVVFLLRGESLDVEAIRHTIIEMGGVSTVVAGDASCLKCIRIRARRVRFSITA